MTSKLQQAWNIGRELGKAAFAAGIRCAPALDPAVNPAIRDVNPTGTVGNRTTNALLKGWHRGWAEANLAAPLPGALD